jgi:hypothetical protein
MEYNTTVPQHSGAYMKYKYGNWIDDDDIIEITTAGTYTLRPLASGKKNICYKIASENPNQYYYFEYRHRNSSYFESGIPGNGLLIYRINTDCNSTGACEGNASYNAYSIVDEVYIFRPGGYIERDPYNNIISHNGTVNNAHFNTAINNRSAFNESTNPAPFLSDGTPGSINISDIIEFNGDSLRFTYNTSKYIDVSNQNLNLPNQVSHSASFTIESNTTWFIRSTGNLFTLNKYSGNGNDTITLSVINYNTSDDYRYDTLFIRGTSASIKQVYIRQDGFLFSVDPQIIEVTKESSTKIVTVNSVGNWNLLDYTLFCDWLTVNPRNGSGETEVTLSIQNFTKTGQRNCTLRFLSAGIQKTVEVVQTDRTGVDEINAESLEIYPNPADHILHVNNKDINHTVTDFTLYDIYGRTIFKNAAVGNAFDIDIKKYEAGIYFLQIQFDNRSVYTSKIIKQ